MGIKQTLSRKAATNVPNVAPNLTSGFVLQALDRAIAGIGPLPPAAEAADKMLDDHEGDIAATIRAATLKHVSYAGAQGFVTNIGGLVTIAVTIPANITGLAVIQCRLIAVIAHLRGYDLADPRVRAAILACLMGPDEVKRLVKRKTLPAPPMAIATAPMGDPTLDKQLANSVASDLIARVLGKRFAVTLSRRVPILGGGVAMTADAWATYTIGRYAAKELRQRPPK